ncbi:hypothetical protein L6164_018712 [Bauhinia variegata]|uniref:Uncharacterized protein n=1 Tax=Bauhinia variegata TaxID=167791 RepID=A0ACB9NCS8_BAUVA|nr:hypothetical protein L6164_018712 [Bauhinia variegata]
MACIVGILVLVLVLVSDLNIGEPSQWPSSDSACDRIFEYFPYCLEFLVEDYYKPSRKCCNHIEKLNKLANHRTGPKFICWCIQLMIKGVTPALIPSKVDDLPKMCNPHLSFPISDSMNCSK